MENRDQNYNGWENPRPNRSGNVMAGLLLVLVGVVILAYKLNSVFLPYWLFSWPVLLIVIGLFIGFRHSFRKPSWLVLVLIGSVFLIDDLIPEFSLRIYFWPVLLIGLGLWVILKPRNRYPRQFQQNVEPQPPYDATAATPGAPTGDYYTSDAYNTYTDNGYASSVEDYVNATAVFGGVKKSVISKNFKGGEVVSVFGGTELNLTQADIQHPVVLDTTQIFGGTTLIVPSNWSVKSEVAAILGGVSDERMVAPTGYDPNKTLIIKGTALFGGLNIKSY